MEDTVYIVSGFMRTGTSMMMRALEAGGMDARYAESRNEMNTKFGDEHYQPNSGGFYELARDQYREFGFPRKWKGCLIKALHGAMWRLVAGDYKVVFMRRDPEEIRQSFEAFFNRQAPPILRMYEEAMGGVTDMLRMRKDVNLVELSYREVVDRPGVAFSAMKKMGWPITLEKAVAVVDPGQCRFRRENLEAGI